MELKKVIKITGIILVCILLVCLSVKIEKLEYKVNSLNCSNEIKTEIINQTKIETKENPYNDTEIKNILAGINLSISDLKSDIQTLYKRTNKETEEIIVKGNDFGDTSIF